MVHLDLNFLDILRLGSRGDQPDDCGPTDDGGLLQDEVIGRLRLEFPGLARRDAAPSRPSGLPVVKEKGADHRDVATHIPNASLAPFELTNDRIRLFFVTILYFLQFVR